MSSIGKSFSKAIALSPNSAEANREYGYYLWQFLGQEAKGLSYLKKANILAPQDAGVHAVLGEMYAIPNPSTHSSVDAEVELRKAMRFDPYYAFPYFALARLYIDQQRYQEAAPMLKAYERLLSVDNAQAASVESLHQRITAGLVKHR